jgi:hypothetical protein
LNPRLGITLKIEIFNQAPQALNPEFVALVSVFFGVTEAGTQRAAEETQRATEQ